MQLTLTRSLSYAKIPARAQGPPSGKESKKARVKKPFSSEV
jgi:hypothetical protein